MGIDARIYVVTTKKLSDKDILDLSYEIGSAFGHNKFFRSEGNSYYPGNHNISRETNIAQDGPTWHPKKGETILEVHVWTRYYGIGYERGDLPFIIAVAEWLERRLPGCTVMYGGDSSGVCAEPFGPEQRAALLDHFASNHGRDYFGHRNTLIPAVCKDPVCELCERPMVQYGYGPGDLGGKWHCGGCGARKKTEDGGKTFQAFKEERNW